MSDNGVESKPAGPSGADELLTVQDAADLLRVSTMTVHRLVASGLITSQPAGQSILVSRSSVQAFLDDAEQARRHG
jgi:excisionase family DNA binding protein